MKLIIFILILFISCQPKQQEEEAGECAVDSLIDRADEVIKDIRIKKQQQKKRLDSLRNELKQKKQKYKKEQRQYKKEIRDLKALDTFLNDTVIYNVTIKDSKLTIVDTIYRLIKKEVIFYDTIKLER